MPEDGWRGGALHRCPLKLFRRVRALPYVSAPRLHDKTVTSSRLWYGSTMQEAPVERRLLCCVSIAWDLS